jgi:aldehyde:ferredoxin oxidoreductase
LAAPGWETYYVLMGALSRVGPLGPETVLTMFVSTATRAAISGQSRFTVNAKSLLTGTIGDGQAGGFFPAEMEFTDFNGIVITGRAA